VDKEAADTSPAKRFAAISDHPKANFLGW